MRANKSDPAESRFYTIEIKWRDLLSQRSHGCRDGRRSIPEVAQIADIHQPIAIPPHDHTLLSRRDEVAEHERARLLKQSSEKCAAIAVLLQNILVAVRKRDDAIAALAAADRPLSPTELQTRHHGEQNIPDDGIADRRSKEHTKALTPKIAAVESAKNGIDSHFARLAEMEADLTNDVREAQARAARYNGHIEALRGLYWRSVVRKHADKDRLIGRVPPPAPTASWITEPNYRTVVGLTLPPGTENLTWSSVVDNNDY